MQPDVLILHANGSNRDHDLEQALEMAGRESFDAVVCDLKMPDMRGEEVVKALKAANPALPVIVITGSVSNISSPIVPGVTVEGVLIKPFGIDEIRALVDKITAS